MSKYTVELRYPVEQALKTLGLSIDEKNWGRIYNVVGLNDYPIFDELYRTTLNDKIIRRYYFREIGAETVGLFRQYMRRTMHEIMPYYNQLYESQELVTDPMMTMNKDYTERWTRDESTDTSTNTRADSRGTNTGSDRNVFQDTPMNGLDTGAIESMDYATNVTFDNTENTSIGTTESTMGSTFNGDFDGTKVHNEKGYDKEQSKLLLTYRKTFLNIDLEIVDGLEGLFMQVW